MSFSKNVPDTQGGSVTTAVFNIRLYKRSELNGKASVFSTRGGVLRTKSLLLNQIQELRNNLAFTGIQKIPIRLINKKFYIFRTNKTVNNENGKTDSKGYSPQKIP